jgi:hypothetical protein
MWRSLFVLLAAVVLAACTSTDARLSFDKPAKPPAGARVLLLKPDVELGLMNLAGVTEPRADWSREAQANIAAAIDRGLQGRGHSMASLDPDTAMDGRTGQLIRLHEVVGGSIGAFEYGAYGLPTHKHGFDWTLGEGAQALAREHDADYLLFLYARGAYSSKQRLATVVALAILGVGLPTGGQGAFASLVDARTGKIIWFTTATAGLQADMRTQEGAEAFVRALLKDAPL